MSDNNTEREKAWEAYRSGPSFSPRGNTNHGATKRPFLAGWDAARAVDAEEINALESRERAWIASYYKALDERDALAQQIAAVRAVVNDPNDRHPKASLAFDDLQTIRRALAPPVTPESHTHTFAVQCRCGATPIVIERESFDMDAVTPESGPLLAIDGKPVCVCPGDDPDWRESLGHEDYCPRAVTPESETNRD